MSLPPVVQTVDLDRTPEDAFRIFTEDLGSWWPVERFSVGLDPATRCSMDCRVGGEISETTPQGERHVWGTIRAWEPPGRLVFSWHPGRDAATAQEVELRFEPASGGTRVTLEHRGWAILGERATEMRGRYAVGWASVLGEVYRTHCSAAGATVET